MTVPALLELAVVVVAAHRRDAVLTALPPRHPLGRLLTAREAVAGSWRGEEQHPDPSRSAASSPASSIGCSNATTNPASKYSGRLDST